jgi:allantoinase
VPMWAVQGQSSDELVKRLSATLAVLERELEQNPRVLSIGLHPHIAGVPHRLYYLEKALDLLMSRSDTVFVTSGEIADWFVAADKSGVADLDLALKARPAFVGHR